MTRKAKIALAITAAAAVLLMTVFAVYAYFTSMNYQDNTMRTAQNTIEVSEQFDPLPQQAVGENRYRKEITIANTGNAPCYVRVYADFSDYTVRSRSFLTNGADQDTAAYYSAERNIDPTDSLTTFPEYINRLDDWEFIPDDDPTKLAGFYYYKTLLPSGESTVPLFTYVKTLNPTEADIQQYDIVVYAESIQLTDMKGDSYPDYRTAWQDALSRSA